MSAPACRAIQFRVVTRRSPTRASWLSQDGTSMVLMQSQLCRFVNDGIIGTLSVRIERGRMRRQEELPQAKGCINSAEPRLYEGMAQAEAPNWSTCAGAVLFTLTEANTMKAPAGKLRPVKSVSESFLSKIFKAKSCFYCGDRSVSSVRSMVNAAGKRAVWRK